MGFGNLGISDNLYRNPQLPYANPGRDWGDHLGIFGNQIKQGGTNFWNHLWSADDMEVDPAGNVKPTNTWKNPFGGLITGTKKTAGEETGDPLSQFEKIWGQTPEEHTKMYSDIAKNAGNYKLENKLKLGMIDNISKLGANLGMGGAQYEYQAALQANKNSAYVTVNSKMNPGPVRYLQPYQSYFS